MEREKTALIKFSVKWFQRLRLPQNSFKEKETLPEKGVSLFFVLKGQKSCAECILEFGISMGSVYNDGQIKKFDK